MDGILNERTNTVHKQEGGTPGLESVCGVTYHLSKDQLERTSTASTGTTTRCGRCFDNGGGY